MKRIRLAITIVMVALPFLVLSLIAIVLGQLLRLIGLKRISEAVVHFVLKILIIWIYIWTGSIVRVEGRENIPADGRVCYVPNHSSMMDIPVLFGSGCWCGIVAKEELFKVPVLHGLLRLLHCIPINRSSLRESAKAIFKGVDSIKAGYAMGIFPEGTRSKTGEMGEMKPGAFKMAIKAGAKIVPVAMANTRCVLEGAANLLPVRIYVRILPPIDTAQMSEEELKDLHTIVENEVRTALKELPGPDGH